MNRNELANAIYNVSHITGKFKLRSGAISNEYFDKYRFESRPDILKNIAEQMKALIPEDIDYLAGLEMGGIPVATALSLLTGIPAVFVRKEAKEYGTCQFVEGTEVNGKKLLIVEDVVTSGGQIIISTNDLRKQGAIIEKAICVIDREAGGVQKLQDAGIALNALFTMTELKANK